MASDQELVERFQDSAQAVMLRDILKGNGFRATIAGQTGMGGSGARLAGGFLVTVPKAEIHDVRVFLKRLEKEAFLHGDDDGDGKKPPRTKPAEPRPARRKEVSLLADDDPRAFYIPTDAELDAEVRRRPVGRTLTYICLDLGLIPGFCGGDMWGEVYSILRYCGGSIHQLYRVRGRREETFERERYRKPDTWHIEWRDFSDAAVRAALGCRIGETPPPIVPVPS